ncbi:hypothetical protein R3P38DRAFT_2799051 [Favolaschia claudopus]|uniref:Ribosomal protein L5 n=1 Tax=Favolaschia claudopus TaxID=2862362 RepID=A0AAW0A0W2_9AGAR
MPVHIQSQTRLLSPYHHHPRSTSPSKLSSRRFLSVVKFSSSITRHQCVEYTYRRPQSGTLGFSGRQANPAPQTSSSVYNATPSSILSLSSSRGAAKRRYTLTIRIAVRRATRVLAAGRLTPPPTHKPAEHTTLPQLWKFDFDLPASELSTRLFFLRCAAIHLNLKTQLANSIFRRPASGMFDGEFFFAARPTLAKVKDSGWEIRFLGFGGASGMATGIQDLDSFLAAQTIVLKTKVSQSPRNFLPLRGIHDFKISRLPDFDSDFKFSSPDLNLGISLVVNI